MAIPSSISGTVSLMKGLKPHGSIVLADGETVQTQSRDKYVGDTITRQLADADVLVMTKSDLLNDGQRASCQTWLESTGKNAPVIVSQAGNTPTGFLLDAPKIEKMGSNLGVDDANAQFESVVLFLKGISDVRALMTQLTTQQTGVVRAKGYVRDNAGQSWLVQSVGRRVELSKSNLDGSQIGLVCIGLSGKLKIPDSVKEVF